MTTQAIGYSVISSFSRVEIMHLIQERPRRTVAELSASTGLHANTVREHLQRLIDAGHVVQERERRTTRGRPRVLFSATTGQPGGFSHVADRKVKQAAQRGDVMRRIMPWTADGVAELGDAATHQIDALVEHLADSGFDPTVDEADLAIELAPCTHAESQSAHRAVLCSVHLSLMQGVLAQAGGPLSVDGMRSSCDPRHCIVRLLHPARTTDQG